MKKVVTTLTLLALVLCIFAGCDTDKPAGASPDTSENAESTDITLSLPDDVPSVYAVFTNKNPKPGEKTDMIVYLHNVTNLAAIDLTFSPSSSDISCEYVNGSTISGLTDNINMGVTSALYGGFVMSSVNVETEELFTIELTIGENCKGEIPFNISVQNLLVASDESGRDTHNIMSDVNIVPAVLTVQ